MKKTITLLLVLTAMIYVSCSPSTLATVGNNGWKVTLYHNSSDVKIQQNGQDVTFVKAFAGKEKPGYAAYSSGIGASGGYLDYTDGIQLDKNSDSHQITLIKGDKTVTVTFTHKSKPFLDVTASLGETKEMSLDELQKEYVKAHKAGKKKSK